MAFNFYMTKCKSCDKALKIRTYRKHLHTGNCRSCHAKSQAQKAGDARGEQKKLRPFEWLYRLFCREAIRYQRQNSITYEQFLEFTDVTQCHYCGDKIQWISYTPKGYKSSAYFLDRVDNNQGYHAKNCVVCCSPCNAMKSEQTKDAFLNRCRKVIVKHGA